MSPDAVTIFDFDKNGWINLQDKNLDKVLMQENIKDMPACIISIVGAVRQGKSFILNFLIRYLKTKYKLEKNVTNSNWLNADNEPITGFSYKNGSKRDTVGILMWSEIFIAKMFDGQEVAVILLDTQGSFDNKSTIDQCGKIFALSTLISSVQIYNLKENIKQNDLMHLEYFAGYGSLFKNNSNSDNNPFQNLILLIRDWSYPFEKNFGADGGNALLNEILNDNDQPDEVISIKKNITDLFEKTNCFLLPHPGMHLARSETFKGNLEEIGNDFKQYVQEFVSSILAPINLTPKKINGNIIKIRDLIGCIKNYADIFKSKEMPKMLSIYEATTISQMTIILEKSQKIYENGMMSVIFDESYRTKNETDLQKLHDLKKLEALQYFGNEKIICNKIQTRQQFEEKLINGIEARFHQYKKFFQTEMDLKDQPLLDSLKDLAKNELTSIAVKETVKYGIGFVTECVLHEVMANLKSTIVESLKEKTGTETKVIKQTKDTKVPDTSLECKSCCIHKDGKMTTTK